jgi:peroxidase
MGKHSCVSHQDKLSTDKCFVKELIKNKYEYRKIDGSGNNLKHGNYGKVGQPLIRKVGSSYEDGYSEPAGSTRPSARTVSNYVCDQENPIQNSKNCSNIFWLWGQFIDHDITLIDTHAEHFNIQVPCGDKYFDPSNTGEQSIGFNRSKPTDISDKEGVLREYINKLSPFIDASNVYGSSVERNQYIRTYESGKLKTSNGGMLPVNDGTYENAGPGVSGLFVSGDIRANEHVGLTCIHTLFVREHNYWATELKESDHLLSDEEIYQKAKIVVEAEIQSITFNEFLPLLLGDCAIPEYNGYDCEINPQISNIFSVACYRLHSLIPTKIFDDLNLKDMFFKPHLLCNEYTLDITFKHYMEYKCEEMDCRITGDLRNFLFGEPGQGGHDLAAINIQRGRDHGLPDYNSVRQQCGLSKKTDFQISENQSDNDNIKAVYDSDIDNIDLFIGSICEAKYNKCSMLGELSHTVVLEQFQKIRSGDRLWYENRLNEKLIHHINKTKLSDIIKRNTCTKHVPCNVFVCT